jgi:hypothetical protein
VIGVNNTWPDDKSFPYIFVFVQSSLSLATRQTRTRQFTGCPCDNPLTNLVLQCNVLDGQCQGCFAKVRSRFCSSSKPKWYSAWRAVRLPYTRRFIGSMGHTLGPYTHASVGFAPRPALVYIQNAVLKTIR